MAKKYYAVKVGRTPGIYMSWADCEKNIKGYSGALYKSFMTLEEAGEFLNTEKIEASFLVNDNYAFVDGSYNIKTKVYGYGGFLICNGKKHIISGFGNDKEMASMRNVSGEILGCMEAVNLAVELGMKEIYIYYDYQGIEMWANGGWKRNKKGTIEYYEFMQEKKKHIDIHFVKVKGHSGVEGNEEADMLAKKAAGII